MTKKYLVLVKSYINNAIREEGDIVEYDTKPGSNLQLVEEDAKEEVVKETKKKSLWCVSSVYKGDSGNLFPLFF